MILICLMQNIDMCLLYKSHQIARFVSHLINHFSKWMFTMSQKNATKFGCKNEILQIFLYHWIASCGYIIMDLCIISFSLNCIVQLKQFYNIATKVSSRKKCYYFWWSTWLLMFLIFNDSLSSYWSIKNINIVTYFKWNTIPLYAVTLHSNFPNDWRVFTAQLDAIFMQADVKWKCQMVFCPVLIYISWSMWDIIALIRVALVLSHWY